MSLEAIVSCYCIFEYLHFYPERTVVSLLERLSPTVFLCWLLEGCLLVPRQDGDRSCGIWNYEGSFPAALYFMKTTGCAAASSDLLNELYCLV